MMKMKMKMKTKMMKKDYPRSFYYKVCQVFCKMLDASFICYGKLSKNDKRGCVIYAIDKRGLKRPLLVIISLNNGMKTQEALKLSKRDENLHDVQKAVVKRILKALEKSDVWIEDSPDGLEVSKIKMDVKDEIEKHVIEWDLTRVNK